MYYHYQVLLLLQRYEINLNGASGVGILYFGVGFLLYFAVGFLLNGVQYFGVFSVTEHVILLNITKGIVGNC